MDNFEEIKNIWQNQKAESLPSIDGIINTIKAFHVRRKREIIFLVFIAVICLLAMIWVIIDYESSLLTTRIGESLFILLGFYLLVSKLNLLKKKKQEELLSATEYLDDLQERSKKEAIDESQPIPVIISVIALILYVYEILAASQMLLIIGYSVLFLLVALIWFVYRPFMIKRNLSKIQNLLDKIDTMKEQTNEKN